MKEKKELLITFLDFLYDNGIDLDDRYGGNYYGNPLSEKEKYKLLEKFLKVNE